MLPRLPAVAKVRDDQGNEQQSSFKHHEEGGPRLRRGLTVLPCGEHPNKSQDQEEPSRCRDEHRPCAHPNIVSAHDS